MKKFAAIILLILFLISNSGMAFTAHYCCGELTSIDFQSAKQEPCYCGKKEMKSDCCKDKTTVLKSIKDLSQTNLFTFKILSQKFELLHTSQNSIIPTSQIIPQGFLTYHPPMIKPDVSIFLLNRVFLI